jgi:hypothetical protein
MSLGICSAATMLALFRLVASTEMTMNQNPYESPREGGISPSKPRSTLGGILQIFGIVFLIMVAIALWDAFAMWLGS